MNKEELVKTLVEDWDSPFVTRGATGKFTSDIVSGRSVANLESQGHKVPGRFLMAKKRAYSTLPYAKYLVDYFFKG